MTSLVKQLNKKASEQYLNILVNDLLPCNIKSRFILSLAPTSAYSILLKAQVRPKESAAKLWNTQQKKGPVCLRAFSLEKIFHQNKNIRFFFCLYFVRSYGLVVISVQDNWWQSWRSQFISFFWRGVWFKGVSSVSISPPDRNAKKQMNVLQSAFSNAIHYFKKW